MLFGEVFLAIANEIEEHLHKITTEFKKIQVSLNKSLHCLFLVFLKNYYYSTIVSCNIVLYYYIICYLYNFVSVVIISKLNIIYFIRLICEYGVINNKINN